MAPQQQSSQNTDNSMAPVWIMVLLFLTAYFVWVVGKKYIVAGVFAANVFQAKIVLWLVNSPQLSDAVFLMQTIDPATVSWAKFTELTGIVGAYIRYPVIVILVLLAILLYQSNIILKFRKTHNMKTLRAQEQFNWPAIMPVIKEDIVDEDISKGPWAMALTPLEFAKKHHLLKKDDALLEKQLPGMEMTAGIRRGDAKRVFTLQLGSYWEGFEHCTPQAYALSAVFIARIMRDRDSAGKILETIDKTFALGKPDFSVARAVLKKYENSSEVQEIIAKHAYTYTVIASLLEGARQDGVVPSAEFLWLKTIDRRLWYMLNSVGRQTPFPEVGGPFAHWKAEKAMGRRSLVPMIDEAIKALEIAIKEIKLSPKVMQELKP